MDLSQHDRPSTVPSSEARPADILAKRRLGLVAGVAMIFVLAGLLTVLALTRLRKSSTTTLGLFPKEAAAVYWVDVPRLRSIGSLQQLRRDILTIPEAQREWDPIVLGCTFDPIDRVQLLGSFIPRATSLAGSFDSTPWSANGIITGNFTAPEAQRCIQALAQRTPFVRLVPRPTVAGRTIVAIGNANDPSVSDAGVPSTPPSPTEVQIATGDRLIAITQASELTGMLRVIDRQSPGADSSERIRNLFSALGGGVLMGSIVDNQFAMGTSALSTAQLMTTLGNSDPALTGFAPLVNAQMSATALQMSTTGYRILMLYQFNATADAAAARASVVSGLAAVRGPYLNGINSAQTEFTQAVARQQPTNPAIASQVAPVQQALAIVTSLIDRPQLRVEGRLLRIEVELSNTEFDAFVNAARAIIAIRRTTPQFFSRP